MLWKKLTILGVVLSVAGGYAYFHFVRAQSPKPWDARAVTATYRSAQLRENDPGSASLILSYDLENNTDQDYRFNDSPGLVIMSRLMSNRNLSSQEDIRLVNPTFLPARQRARITLQIRHPFEWPSDDMPGFQNKLKEFVNERLSDVQEFVLFDQADHCQIAFPRGWEDLNVQSAAFN